MSTTEKVNAIIAAIPTDYPNAASVTMTHQFEDWWVQIHGGNSDDFQPQTAGIIRVEKIRGRKDAVVIEAKGWALDILLDALLEFVSTETPVPA